MRGITTTWCENDVERVTMKGREPPYETERSVAWSRNPICSHSLKSAMSYSVATKRARRINICLG
jgi:hypothetical protein